MSITLLVTILVESVIAVSYSWWRRKPIAAIWVTSFFANLITQTLLWVTLNLFFRHYLSALLAAELLIWMLESVLLYSISANHLRFGEAVLLSLGMNLASFALGWFLPV